MSTPSEPAHPRRGPSPLPIHIALALAEYARVQQSGAPPDAQMQGMLAGIRKYQEHPYRRTLPPLPVVWQKGQVRIFRCPPAADSRAAVLLLPSLINKSHILDLMPGKSFVRWLAGQGIEAYLLDWGAPMDDPGLQDMDGLLLRLGQAIAAMAERGGRPVHALGYCMGGTLLAGAAARQREALKSLLFLASPWDFAAGDRRLAGHIAGGTPAALQIMQSRDCLPMDWIQGVFAAVNADRTVHKFANFAALADESEAAQLFVAVEDWLNDGIDLPRRVAHSCIVEWYGENRPARGLWQAGGVPVDPAAFALPALVMASADDRLVPLESAMALARAIPGAAVLRPDCGHIGMMTGSRAAEKVWRPVAEWVLNAAA